MLEIVVVVAVLEHLSSSLKLFIFEAENRLMFVFVFVFVLRRMIRDSMRSHSLSLRSESMDMIVRKYLNFFLIFF